VTRSIVSGFTFAGLVVIVAIISAAVGGGCQSTTTTTPQSNSSSPYLRKAPAAAAAAQPTGATNNKESGPAISNTDPCASRLHDICEPLLLYYLKNHQLPGRLEDLRDLPGFEQIELTCPVSKQAYLYNPVGITTAESRARIICYDPTPAHAGCRWAISIIEPEADNGPLITKVIGLPESHFTFMGGR
jgi:hypothetical protein